MQREINAHNKNEERKKPTTTRSIDCIYYTFNGRDNNIFEINKPTMKWNKKKIRARELNANEPASETENKKLKLTKLSVCVCASAICVLQRTDDCSHFLYFTTT